MEEKKIELKPCPFCGAVPLIDHIKLDNTYSVRCANGAICDVLPQTYPFDSKEEAAEAWNRRAEK